VYVEVPKKNGKSELAAGAGIYQLYAVGEKNGEVYGCAADREQASIVFDVAVDMIDQVPELKKRTKLNLSKRMITDKVSGSIYRVLSAEAYTKHGLNVSACIFDELHAQPNRGLWDVMTFGAGDARLQPIWWIITTAGDDPDRVSVGWEQHEKAVKILAGEWSDPTWYPVIYGYEGEDIYNPANWALANPSLGHTITVDSVREAAEASQMNKSNERLFRWLRLNQWVTTKLTTWLPLDLFDQTVGSWERADLIGEECYLGMDLSSTTDLTALCWIFPPQGQHMDWRVFWDCFIPADNMQDRIKVDHVPYDNWVARAWIIPTEGNVVDYTKLEEHILLMSKLYKIREIDADRTFAAMLLQRLEQAGITAVDIPQQYGTLTDPMNEVERLLKTKKLTHENNPVARWTFGNTSVHKNGNAQIKYVKETRGRSTIRTKRIDPIAAWVTGMARARFHSGSVDISEAILSPEFGF
jgi:phage terminase large subunit-like protein